jgi:hypothetical protein
MGAISAFDPSSAREHTASCTVLSLTLPVAEDLILSQCRIVVAITHGGYKTYANFDHSHTVIMSLF